MLDKNELEKTMIKVATQLGLGTPSSDKVQKTFIALDINCDGKIDFLEFKKFVRPVLEEMCKKKWIKIKAI